MGSVLLMGFLIGLRHALEADHLAAVASLATGGRGWRSALRLGLAWGLGHAVTLILVASVVLVMGGLVPEAVAVVLEGLVGAMLVVLGSDVLLRAVRQRIHFHAHRHGESVHVHAHSHAGEGEHRASRHDHRHAGASCLRAGVIGSVQGLAGSAALILLSLGALQSAWTGFAYVFLFGFGTLVGMGCLSCAIALPLRWLSRYLDRCLGLLYGAVGLVTLWVGASIVFSSFPALRSVFTAA